LIKHKSSLWQKPQGNKSGNQYLYLWETPEDHLDIDTFYKAEAYAGLYKSYGETVDSIKADDVTVSLVRDAKPEGLFRYFREHNYPVTNPYSGVYYAGGAVLFPTQIIVTGELKPDAHIWLRALSDRVGKQDMAELLKRISQLTEKGDRELADSVLEVSARVNMQVLEELKGDDSVSEALLEIMEPLIEPRILLREEAAKRTGWEEGLEKGLEEGIEKGIKKGIAKGIEKGIEKGREEGIQGTVDVLHDLGHEDAEIRQIIRKKYGLSEEKAAEYL